MCTTDQKGDILSWLKAEAKNFTSCAALINQIGNENAHDAACGSWIAKDTMCALTIRKREDHYSAILSDISKCYKVVRECFKLKIVRGKLQIFQMDGTTTLEQVSLDPEDETLIFGSYGVFHPEDIILLEERDEYTDVLVTDQYEL